MSFHEKNSGGEVYGDFSKLDELVKNLSKNYHVDIGILGKSVITEKNGETTAAIGARHEFGVPEENLPERSFIRMPLETGQSEIEQKLEPKIKELLATGNIKGIFKLIGVFGEARIQEAFETGGFGSWPDLSEITKLMKGSDAILIDTGNMRKSIASEVGGD